MIEEKTYDELLQELKQLAEENPEIDYSDEVAYYEKCKMLDHVMHVYQETGLGLETSRVYLSDFFGEIFERPLGGDLFFEPFQEKESPHYMRWRDEEKDGITEHDYKHYEEPRFAYNPLLFYKSKRPDRK